MKKQFDEHKTRLVEGRMLIEQVLQGMPRSVRFALRVYGEHADQGKDDCQQTHLLVPFSVNNGQRIMEVTRLCNPQGRQPLEYAIRCLLTEELRGVEGRTVVVLLTDGADSCYAPLGEALSKVESPPEFVILSLDSTEQHAEELRRLATQSHGKYYDFTQTLMLSQEIRHSLWPEGESPDSRQ